MSLTLGVVVVVKIERISGLNRYLGDKINRPVTDCIRGSTNVVRARILACVNGWKTTREKTTSEVFEVTLEEPLRCPSSTC